MLKKQKVLVYLTQILCVRHVENKAGNIIPKIDRDTSDIAFNKFPNRKTADFPTNGLSVSKGAYFRRRYFKLYKLITSLPENPVGINRHKLAIRTIESYGYYINQSGKPGVHKVLNAENKYAMLEKLISIYCGRIRQNIIRSCTKIHSV